MQPRMTLYRVISWTLAVALVAGFLARPAWSADPGDFLNLVKIDDGNTATCEHGYAGSGVNNVAYIIPFFSDSDLELVNEMAEIIQTLGKHMAEEMENAEDIEEHDDASEMMNDGVGET